ncbi:hypothetical protein [Acetobacter pasteurianus]|uniref:hypothetical protein n=1 Tax=Acetobacter pasteurianus TaxID=438 RepID=UPI0013637CDA|nr:hypothetical protein [Acetobacter pasteurianus]QHM90072.1 hypothetical protein FCN51_00275 [Acetobacter pasteurianus]
MEKPSPVILDAIRNIFDKFDEKVTPNAMDVSIVLSTIGESLACRGNNIHSPFERRYSTKLTMPNWILREVEDSDGVASGVLKSEVIKDSLDCKLTQTILYALKYNEIRTDLFFSTTDMTKFINQRLSLGLISLWISEALSLSLSLP